MMMMLLTLMMMGVVYLCDDAFGWLFVFFGGRAPFARKRGD